MCNITWSRSSGKGGQHVNMNDTKASVKYKLSEPEITEYMINRLKLFYPKLITKDHHIMTEKGGSRERQQNLAAAIQELQDALDFAARPPPAAEDTRKNSPSPVKLMRQKESEVRSKRIERGKRKMDSIHV